MYTATRVGIHIYPLKYTHVITEKDIYRYLIKYIVHFIHLKYLYPKLGIRYSQLQKGEDILVCLRCFQLHCDSQVIQYYLKYDVSGNIIL